MAVEPAYASDRSFGCISLPPPLHAFGLQLDCMLEALPSLVARSDPTAPRGRKHSAAAAFIWSFSAYR